jgi:hypothetical protein
MMMVMMLRLLLMMMVVMVVMMTTDVIPGIVTGILLNAVLGYLRSFCTAAFRTVFVQLS